MVKTQPGSNCVIITTKSASSGGAREQQQQKNRKKLGCQLASILLKFKFTENLQAEFKVEFSDLYRIYDKFKIQSTFFVIDFKFGFRDFCLSSLSSSLTKKKPMSASLSSHP